MFAKGAPSGVPFPNPPCAYFYLSKKSRMYFNTATSWSKSVGASILLPKFESSARNLNQKR